MTCKHEGEQVTLSMTLHDYCLMMFMLGIAGGLLVKHNDPSSQQCSDFIQQLWIANASAMRSGSV